MATLDALGDKTLSDLIPAEHQEPTEPVVKTDDGLQDDVAGKVDAAETCGAVGDALNTMIAAANAADPVAHEQVTAVVDAAFESLLKSHGMQKLRLQNGMPAMESQQKKLGDLVSAMEIARDKLFAARDALKKPA